MKFKNAEVDMLHGPLIKKLLLFTHPIALSSILQQLFNAADTAVVGYFGNKDALAAVGTNTEIVALIVTVSSGLSIGANILVANLIGKNRKNEIPSAVKTSVVLSVLIGAFGMILGQFLAEPLLRLIQAPDSILRDAVLYLRIYMLGYPFLLLYDFGSAILRARGGQPIPLLCLGLFRRRQCRAQSVFRNRVPHGRGRRCHCHRHFQYALGADCIAPADERKPGVSGISQATILSEGHR